MLLQKLFLLIVCDFAGGGCNLSFFNGKQLDITKKGLFFQLQNILKPFFTCLLGEQNTNLDSIKRYFIYDRFWFFFIRWVAVRHVFLTVFLTAENLLLFPFRRSICRPSIVIIIIHPISARNLLPNLPHTFRHYSGIMLLCNWDRDNSV